MRTLDLIVVGGGPAGIGCAYRLRDSGLEIKVLEADDQVGGRTRGVMLPGGIANPGAQFAYRATPSEELATELGLAAIPFEPTTYGISVDGMTSIGSSNAEVVDGLGWAGDDRDTLVRVLDEAVAEYRATTEGGALTERSDALASETVADRLKVLPERVARVIESAVRGGSVGDSAQLSAQYALRYFASYPALEQENRLLLDGGMQALVIGMAERLGPDVVSLNTAVTSVRADGDEYVVTATGPDGEETHRARQVLLAVPAPLVSGLVPDLPADKHAAIATADTPGSTIMVVAIDATGLERLRDWAFVTTVGRRFDCIINPTAGHWRSEREPGIVHLTCYGNSAGYRPDLPGDAAAEEEWLEDLYAVEPELRGRVLAHHLRTWEHCFAALSLERAAVLEQLQAQVGGIHFAGDWTSKTAGTHGALGEAARVAEAVLAHRA